MKSYTSLVTSIAIFSALTYLIQDVLYQVHPIYHIDEVFHVPQALKYCNFSFYEWDPKITTLPGLYLYSLAFVWPVSQLLRYDVCNLYMLRLVNVSTTIMHFFNIYSTLYILNKQKAHATKSHLLLWTAWNISIFPPMYFWSFFYYTDVLSSFLVFVMYNYHLRQSYYRAAFVGALSVIVRQTNVIWVGFMLLTLIGEFVVIQSRKASIPRTFTVKYMKRVVEVILTNNSASLLSVLKQLFGYICVCLLFLIFLCVNKGIVVGDRSAHKPVVNVPQLFYFIFFTLVFVFPFALPRLKTFIKLSSRSIFGVFWLLSICAVIIKINFVVHPYLLADNRHYSFYVWKRIFDVELYKYMLIPLYIFGMYFITVTLEMKPLVKLSYWLCVFILIVPQKLLEFRYFLTPFLMFRIHITSQKSWQLFLESLLYSFINIFVFFMFITKSIYWHDSSEVQRLGW